jgi:hypothetical protein
MARQGFSRRSQADPGMSLASAAAVRSLLLAPATVIDGELELL